VRNAWFATRIPISRSRLLARTLSLRAAGDRGRLTRRTEVCIDGFQRSGNTLAVYAVWRSNPECRIAHHLHAAGDVRRAVERGIPTVVLIREPSTAIASLIAYQGMAMHVRLGLESYIAFYRHLVPVRDGFAVCPFDELVADPGLPIRLLNGRFGLGLLSLPLDEADRKELQAAIGHTQRLRGEPERKWSVPVPNRDAVRARTVDQIASHPRLAVAESLYRTLVDRGSTGGSAGASIGPANPVTDPLQPLARTRG
jgi:hypothetical protein